MLKYRPTLFMLALIAIVTITTGLLLAQDRTPTPRPGIEINPDAAAQGFVETTETIAESTAGTLTEFLSRLSQTPRNDLVRALLLIGGIVLLIAGWRVSEFIIIIAGLVVGASVGVSLMPEANTALQVVGLVVGSIVGILLAALVYYMAVFAIGAYVGIVVTGAVAAALTTPTVSPLVLLVGGIIGGVILLGLSFQLLIVVAALIGAQMLTVALGLSPVWIIILTIVGIVIQLIAARVFGVDIRRLPRRRLWRRA